MKKRLCCALLALLLAAPLCACGGAGRRGEGAASPAEEAPAAAEAVTMIDEPVFPLLSAPFSESESEAMVNHNAARFAITFTTPAAITPTAAARSCAMR